MDQYIIGLIPSVELPRLAVEEGFWVGEKLVVLIERVHEGIEAFYDVHLQAGNIVRIRIPVADATAYYANVQGAKSHHV